MLWAHFNFFVVHKLVYIRLFFVLWCVCLLFAHVCLYGMFHLTTCAFAPVFADDLIISSFDLLNAFFALPSRRWNFLVRGAPQKLGVPMPPWGHGWLHGDLWPASRGSICQSLVGPLECLTLESCHCCGRNFNLSPVLALIVLGPCWLLTTMTHKL